MSTLLAVAILALTASGLTVYVVRVVVSSRIDQHQLSPERSMTSYEFAELKTRVDKNWAEIQRMVLAVSEGIARVDRAENRIQKTVTSARRLVRDAGLEHAGIEAEYAELQPSDDEGVVSLSAMPEEMASTRTVRVPGGSLEVGAA